MVAAVRDSAPFPPAPLEKGNEFPHRQLQSHQLHQQHGNPKVIGNYIFQQSLGKGSMGKVKLAVHSVTGDKIAIKIVPRANFQAVMTEKDRKREENRELRTIREAHIMMLLRHPNIVGLKDLVTIDPYFYILMEYVNGGQLLHYIVRQQRLSERRSRHFARQIVSALDYMHCNSIVHRDLKIENILIDKAGRNVKLIDFGLSNLFYPGHMLQTFCGSLYFAAPELLNAQPYVGPEIDVWSLGVVIYVMVTGTVPFDDKTIPGLHEKIKRGRVSYPTHMSNECKDLLSQIFVLDPKKRITVTEIIQHPWMNVDNTAVKNFLPTRKPITLPLDQSIIEKMNEGFHLGSEESIRTELEAIVRSDAYKAAVASVTGKKPSSNGVPGAPSNASTSIPDKSILQHPLVSLYHLIRERQEHIASGTTSIGRIPALSRRTSVESACSLNSARSSQVSLALSEDGRRPLSSTLSQRPDYQLVADSSVPGFTAQPSTATGSNDYLARIQRWLRSSTSQHRLSPTSTQPTFPEPTSPRYSGNPATHTTAAYMPAPISASTSTPIPARATPTADSSMPKESVFALPPKTSIFRKFSKSLLRRKSSVKSSVKKPVTPTYPLSPEALRDRPLPPLPTDIDARPKQMPASPPFEERGSVEPTPPTDKTQPTAAKSITTPLLKTFRHKRSQSSTSAQFAAQAITDKIGAWLQRSSSLHSRSSTNQKAP